jgi:hypothetical protein
MAKETKSKIYQVGPRHTIYLSKDLVSDSTFPFEPKEEINIRIENNMLVIEKSPGTISMQLMLLDQIATVLDEAHIKYARNVLLTGSAFISELDLVIPSGSAPKVVIKAEFIRPYTEYEAMDLKAAAFEAMDLKRKMKNLKFVLVVGTSKENPPDNLAVAYILSQLQNPEYFDKVFYEENLEELPKYIQKTVGPSSEK